MMPSKLKVLVTGPITEHAAEKLSSFAETDFYRSENKLEGQELITRLQGCDAVVCQLSGPITKDVIDHNPTLKLIANVAVGYDNIDVEEATKKEILVLNTPGVLDDATADIAFALLISTARRIVEADKFVRAGKWEGFRLDLMLGEDLAGKTVGIIGLGRIGQAFARRCLGFGMKVIYSQRNRADAKIESELNAVHVNLDELLKRSDFISIHCPLTKETTHLIDERALSLVKPGCIFVNTSRGPVVDINALIAALKNGKLYGAGLDVYEHEPEVPAELIAMNNVTLLPHIGSATEDTRKKMSELAVDGLISAFSGKAPSNIVNKTAWDAFCNRISSPTSTK
ncbi:MAG: D-glycerate dehydrogenase [Candidatus Obscuribacterales bacterium]|nr:D-glycerate dehydrogenase [Candidatus Obscuribacterales bacterium]